MRFFLLITVILFSGCSLLTPGIDERQALAARQTTNYDAEGNFSTEESTTHERNNVVLEGENVTAEFGPDGKLLKLTGATNVMVQISRPRDAAEALQVRDTLNAQIALELLNMIKQMTPIIMAGRPATSPSGTSVSGTVTTPR